ncbi:MAG TPA: hypothetical protein VHV30_14140 [Polyangiaceae bacterium]|jgi:hypothetical protein|nr:hypothetical protein [Polyangiaceae bacterium]
MKRFSKAAMIAAWGHVVWMTAGVAAPGIARAQPPATSAGPATPAAARPAGGGDVIELKTGGLLRGTLVDAIPNQRARIQLVTGEVATVPWQDIANIVRADRGSTPAAGAPSAAPPPAPPPASPAPPPASDDGTVFVHIVGSEGADLERDTGDHKHFDTVCSSPCDQRVSLKDEYRIGGAGIRNSKPFKLVESGPPRRNLYVEEGSKGSFALGIVGLSVGPAVAVVGLVIVAVNAVDEDISGNDDSNGKSAGWITAVAGLALAIGGGVLMGSNIRSGVSQTPPASERDGLAAGPSIAIGGPGFSKVLRDTRTEAPAPPPTSVPLFSARF